MMETPEAKPCNQAGETSYKKGKKSPAKMAILFCVSAIVGARDKAVTSGD